MREAPLSWKYFPRIQKNLAEIGYMVKTEQDLDDLTFDLYEQRVPVAEMAAMYSIAEKTIQNHLYATGRCRTVREAQTKNWRYFRRHREALRRHGVHIATPDDLDQWCKDQYERAFWPPRKIAEYIDSTQFTVKRHLRRVGTTFRVAGGASGNMYHPPLPAPIPEEEREASPYTPGDRLVIATPGREYEATFRGWYTSPFGTCLQVSDPVGCFDVRNVSIDVIKGETV